jgi:hypothetical protein
MFSGDNPVDESFRLFLKWLGDNQNDLSEQASQYYNTILDNLFLTAEQNAKKMSESPEKRQALRLAASGLGKHISASGLLKGLEREPSDQDIVLKSWSATLLNSHQAILDLLFDITSFSSGIEGSAIMLSLFYGCVDELTAAHHLGRHHYYTQANGHLRTVVETLDRIELFILFPETVQIWSGKDKAKIRKELAPSKIREKLGKNKFDPIYSFLSEHGTHATFEMFKNRTVNESTDKSKQARVFVAGTPFEHTRMFHCVFSLMIANMVVGKIVKFFESFLNAEECETLLTQLATDMDNFNKVHFIPWAKENNLDASGLNSVFESFIDPKSETNDSDS